MIKAIIFDCFGVIRVDALDAAYQHFGGDVVKDHDFILKTIEDSNSGRIPSSLPVIAAHLGIEEQAWREAIDSGSTLNESVLEYALELRKTYKTAMLSNIGSGGLDRMFGTGFLERYFDAWVASGEIGFAKPDARAYEITAEKLGVRLDECVFIDDRQDYVDGAITTGMQAVLYTDVASLKEKLAVILR